MAILTFAIAAGAVGVLADRGGDKLLGRSAQGALVAGTYPPLPGRPGRAWHRQVDARIRALVRLGVPIYCGGRRGNAVAFTFDDGPGPYTHLTLRKLRQARERATFFVVGKSMNAYPRYLPRELKLAAIGDHTYTHPDLVTLQPSAVAWQLERTAQMIHAQSGEHVVLWRPPYEADDQAIRATARRLGLLEILWSIDSQDWFGADWSQIIKNVEAGLRPGAIVLFHENHGQTIRALTALLPYLHRHHLRSVTVPQLLVSDPPSAAQLRQGHGGCGTGIRLHRGAA